MLLLREILSTALYFYPNETTIYMLKQRHLIYVGEIVDKFLVLMVNGFKISLILAN